MAAPKSYNAPLQRRLTGVGAVRINAMNTPQDSSLGREVAYPDRYDPGLLFPIPRAAGRNAIGVDADLPFIGHDRWHAYELSWLDLRGKPQVAVATLRVPCDSPYLIESKSLKLYLNSLNGDRIGSADEVCARIVKDLSACAGAPVRVQFGLPEVAVQNGQSIDEQALDINEYGPPNADHLAADANQVVEELLTSALLKSNCPVTGQPDWAHLSIRYRGPALDRAGLLRYLISFREHAEFHEQCVERIFHDLQQRCAPQWLQVEARYTRRGGLDINPYRSSRNAPAAMQEVRELRQ